MVSWKTKYLELLDGQNKVEPTGFKCPECEHQLNMVGEKEIVCSNKDCKYDRVIGDFLSNLFDLYKPSEVKK
jgi:hypothetical protein